MVTKDVVSAREAARMIGRNERTVRRWIVQDQGKPNPRLPGTYQDQDGIFRVPVGALRPFLPDTLEVPNGQASAPTGEVSVPNAVLAAVSPSWLERAIAAEERLHLLVRLLERDEEHVAKAVVRAWGPMWEPDAVLAQLAAIDSRRGVMP